MPELNDAGVSEKTGSEKCPGSNSGEKPPFISTPKGGNGVGTNTKAVGKLDTSAFKPFGSVANISVSRSSSDTSDSNSELAFCQGGPGNQNCGSKVTNGEKAVQCDRCQYWFHTKCQAIPKLAHDALVKFKCLSWLCEKCKTSIKAEDEQVSFSKNDGDSSSLENKLQDISDAVKAHMKLITQSMKEQEKVVSDSSKLVERMFREQHTQKSTYADMVRGTCDRVVKDVSAKIEALPVRVGAKETPEARTVVSDAFNDFMDKERRKLNVVVHNLPESDAMSVSERSECDKELFKDVIKEGLNLIVHPTRSFRAGKKLGDRPRLLIVSLASEEVKGDLLRMAPQLRYLSTWERIYVTPDLSKKEREEGKKLRIELTARKHAGESDIMIKRGKIVKVPAKPSSERSGQGSGPAPRAAKIGGEQVQPSGSSKTTQAQQQQAAKPVAAQVQETAEDAASVILPSTSGSDKPGSGEAQPSGSSSSQTTQD